MKIYIIRTKLKTGKQQTKKTQIYQMMCNAYYKGFPNVPSKVPVPFSNTKEGCQLLIISIFLIYRE